MYRKPIGPTAHGVIDYAFATLNTLAPTLFGLTGPAKAICYSFAATQGTLVFDERLRSPSHSSRLRAWFASLRGSPAPQCQAQHLRRKLLGQVRPGLQELLGPLDAAEASGR
jgi:hypothetical protein